MRNAGSLRAKQLAALVHGCRKGLVGRSADYRHTKRNMNLPTFAFRVSELVKPFPLLHKGLRRMYCLFHPGIRLQSFLENILMSLPAWDSEFGSKPCAQTSGAGMPQHCRKRHGRVFDCERAAKA